MKNQGIRNIVIVHGAFADASGWESVYNILKSKGYKVTLVQNSTNTLTDDVNATIAAIERQDGPVLLVGHSWGGTVITEAGAHDLVAALVYVTGFVPDENESTLELVESEAAPELNSILPPDSKGLVYLDEALFNQTFATGQNTEKSAFMYNSQIPLTVTSFIAPVSKAAWKIKPSYAILVTDDGMINPVLQRKMYTRAGSVITELTGGHTLFMTQPEAVANVLTTAAETVLINQ